MSEQEAQVLDNTEQTNTNAETQVQLPDYSFVSDKFKVYKEGSDTDLDLDSTLQKLHKSYSELEKKIGSKGVLNAAPKPVELDLTEFDQDYLENNKDLVELAKANGLSKEAFKTLTDTYNDKIKQVLEYKEQETYENTITQLEGIWGKDTEVQVNYANDAIIKLGFSEDEIAAVANNIPFIKLAAAFGSQLGEHKAPSVVANSSSLRDLVTNPAYSDSRHPDHKAIVSQVQSLYAQGHSLKS